MNAALPVIAIVGRPNVGKSTLFNALTRGRDALVADQPGLTRDRRFGVGRLGPCPYVLVDTGGIDEGGEMESLVTAQALRAVEESQRILFLVDGREGLNGRDQEIAQRLRQFNKPVFLVVNKTEGLERDLVCAEFAALGLGPCYPIASAHRYGLGSLMRAVLDEFAEAPPSPAAPEEEKKSIKVAVIGRPNVGKSTLVNRMLGEERQLTFDAPGTTRDSIAIPFERDGQAYTLIDTAGVRRRAKVSETIEKFSVIKSLQAIEKAHVVIMLLDAREGISDQDSTLLGYVLDSGRALLIAVNKWDGLSPEQREQVKRGLSRKLHFIDFTKPRFISALHGSGVGKLFGAIQQAWRSAMYEAPTSHLNRVFENIIESHPPPLSRGRRIKLRYIHQGGRNPPLFIIHGNQISALPDSYKRYLSNSFREAFKLQGTPVKLLFKQGENPFQDRRNTLTPRQERKRRRLLRHVKK